MRIEISKYKNLLKHYILTKDEKSLYGAEQISKILIGNNVLPGEIIQLHIQALNELFPHLTKDMRRAMDFLLETMILYGTAYKQFRAIQEKQEELKAEMEIAAKMQEKLLTTQIPDIMGLDIGAISVPAHYLNGDYYQFMKRQNNTVDIVIADVVGKGIPAALCMTMIKYALDSLYEEPLNPAAVLTKLNHVAAKNLDEGMFVTMFHGKYNPHTSTLYYASAGHEPGFYYNSRENCFEEIEQQGLVLGISQDTTYQSYEKVIHDGDMVILLTDGVTECRHGERFLETEEVLDVIRKFSHLPAQVMVEKSFAYFRRQQDFNLRDDFTLIILKKEVS